MSKNEKIAIKVQGVSKDFILPHESQDSLKSKLLHPLERSSGYEKQHALRDISFEVKKGEFFGIVGRTVVENQLYSKYLLKFICLQKVK